MTINAGLSEQAKIVTGLDQTAPSGSTPDYVSMKNYPRCTVIIKAKNTTTVTGSAITLKQATAVAGTGEKELAIARARRNTDTAASDTLVEFDVTGNTFNTDNTNSKNSMYVIEVREDDLDVANNFDCIRAGTGNSVNAALDVTYILWPAKIAKATPPSSIVD